MKKIDSPEFSGRSSGRPNCRREVRSGRFASGMADSLFCTMYKKKAAPSERELPKTATKPVQNVFGKACETKTKTDNFHTAPNRLFRREHKFKARYKKSFVLLRMSATAWCLARCKGSMNFCHSETMLQFFSQFSCFWTACATLKPFRNISRPPFLPHRPAFSRLKFLCPTRKSGFAAAVRRSMFGPWNIFFIFAVYNFGLWA